MTPNEFDITIKKPAKKQTEEAPKQEEAAQAEVDTGPIRAQDSDDAPVVPEGIDRPKIKGVFSCETESKVGTGTTQKKNVMKSFWYAEEIEGEGEPIVMVQALNSNMIPSGPKESVVLTDFLERYEPEVEYYQNQVYPKMRELDKTLKRAENQRDLGAYYSAEHEFGAALQIDEENVRANFGLGLTYMERGEPSKARNMFDKLVGLDAAFSPEHKHLFNEFGINLRKSNLTEQAVDYYVRALEMATAPDENLHYNMARAYFDHGDVEQSRDHLVKALDINPDFEEAKGFLAYLKKHGA